MGIVTGVRHVAASLLAIIPLLVAGCASGAPTGGTITPSVTPSADSGAWAVLRGRPLRLLAVAPGMQCPSTPARTVSDIGPVPGEVVVAGSVYISYYPSVHDGTMEFGDGPSFAKSVGGPPTDWGGQKVLWRILPSYQGPVLVRGKQLDGPNELRFNGGIDEQAGYASLADAPLLAELRLQTTTTEATSNWSTYIRLRAPGCYGVQVDGLPFSASVIFRAVLAPGSSSTPAA